MSFTCTIREAETKVKIEVIRAKTSTPLEALRREKTSFAIRHKTKIPQYIKELLMRKHFSFVPSEIRNRAYKVEKDYKIRFHFDYEDARTTTLQSFLRRVTRWKIISTEIVITHNEESNSTTLEVKLSIMRSLVNGPKYLVEVRNNLLIHG